MVRSGLGVLDGAASVGKQREGWTVERERERLCCQSHYSQAIIVAGCCKACVARRQTLVSRLPFPILASTEQGGGPNESPAAKRYSGKKIVHPVG